MRVISRSNVIPDILLSYRKKRHCLYVRSYYMKIYHGPERTEYCTDLNVLQGKAYENLADLNTFETSVSLRDRVKSYN